MDFLDKLNKEQRIAAEHMDGPCLVTAGAGTGKTSVLTARIANLINSGIPAENILAITFTRKAAKEMKDRANKIINCENSTISTFHSFGVKIVKENATELGFDKKIIILNDDDCVSLVKKIVKDMGYDIKKDEIDIGEIMTKITQFKNTLMSKKDIQKEKRVTLTQSLIPDVYEEYKNRCKKYCYVDFDDLLVLPLELFKKYSDILEKYQDEYKYILIDEYQDTNVVQYELVKLLASKYKNIFCVGDINQNIYAFRFADYRNVLKFTKDYPNAKKITLAQNYRSTNMILNAANSVIVNNKERADVTLHSNNGVGKKISCIETLGEYAEANVVVQGIKNLLIKGYKETDIALLYRNNFQSRLYEAALAQEGISYNVVGNSFFDRKEIKDLIAYLRVIANTHDDLALKRIINVPKRGIGEKSVEKLEDKAKQLQKSIYDVIEPDSKEMPFKELIEMFIRELKAHNVSLIEIVDSVLNYAGLIDMYEETGNTDDKSRIQNLVDFKSVVRNYCNNNPDATLDDFLEELGLSEDVETPRKKLDGVTLMTLHKSKGLEFPVVFIVGAEKNMFPGIQTEEEEERRLIYVGITRAKELLYFTASESRLIFGETKFGPRLPFIDEIDKNCINFYSR